MEKDAPKGHGLFGIPTNLECLLLWFSTSRGCLPVAVKNPPGFCGPLIVRCTSCPISRRLPRSDIGGTACSVRRWEQSEPDGGGDAPPKERTTGRGSCPLWDYKGPCPLVTLSPTFLVSQKGGPPEGRRRKVRFASGFRRSPSARFLAPSFPSKPASLGFAGDLISRWAAGTAKRNPMES